MRAVVFDVDQTVFDGNQQLYAGVFELLTIVQRLGFKIGALTRDDHRALVRLDEAGIRQFFDTAVCSDHMKTPKSTSGMQRVLSEMGVEAHHAMIVSQAHSDIILGKNSGLHKTIGVAHSHDDSNHKPLQKAGADHIVHDIFGVLDVLE